MPSTIAWLDADSDDQARMRDIIKLFTDKDSRDELGLGQVRDTISDALFPGTSVLLTRARYLLFVPWCFQLAEGRTDPLVVADRHERTLIATLRSSGVDDLTGLLGARAGQSLQTLPSTIYWGSLRRYGILGDEYISKADVFRPISRGSDGDDAPHRRAPTAWSATLPSIPEEFPHSIDRAFELSRDEAEWLRDRILDRAPGTLLAHLMDNAPLKESRSPWSDPGVSTATGEARELLRNAEAFSTAMHGASLLYNLLLAEEYEATISEERRRFAAPIDDYRERLSRWAERATSARLDDWDVHEFVTWTFRRSATAIAPGTVRFIRGWVDELHARGPDAVADAISFRKLVRDRERQQKRAQARLGNPKRLSAWSGAAGAGALLYRWATVRDIALDIHAGLGRHA